MTDKQEACLIALIHLEEDDKTWFFPWMSAREIADTERRSAFRGNWLGYRGWDPEGIVASLRRLELQGLVRRRSTGRRGKGLAQNEWQVTPAGFEAWDAAVNAEFAA